MHPQDYRRRAEGLRAAMARAPSPDMREALARLARAWDDLAEQNERMDDMARAPWRPESPPDAPPIES